VVGHNGSGKSTLLKLLARQQNPSGGHIRFEGKPIEGWRSRAFARRLAYLPQSLPQAEGMLVGELVALGRYAWHGALGRFDDADRTSVSEAIALMGIDAFSDREVDTPSDGERQCAWLAMLVAQDVRTLLLDELIAALDVTHRMEVLGLVQRLSQDRGLSVLVVLHDVNMAARYCDEILAMHSGRLIARGTSSETMTPAMLERIYGLPLGVMKHPADGRSLSFIP